MANRLAESTSPYLLQHADNPVDWRPWGPEAFAEAAAKDLPVMVSIGYSTCHWCHVMAQESFSDPAIAQQLRETAVSVKVDREELPGVDAVFMDALLAMRGQGGWPLTAFATPQGRPFFAGTYFPPEPRQGMPSFSQVLEAISRTWQEQRGRADEIAASLHEKLGRVVPLDVGLPEEAAEAPLPEADALAAAVESLLGSEDRHHGGFGTAPKFPPTMALIHLLRHRDSALTQAESGESSAARGPGKPPAGEDGPGVRETGSPAPRSDAALGAVRRAFAGMASGGMRDHVGGGIARYSVDARWHVPHFEKMLYDNALYLRAATAWHRAERDLDADSRFTRLADREARDTAAFLLAELRLPGGAFAAGLDADSEDDRGGHTEGAYYLEADLPAVAVPAATARSAGEERDGGEPAESPFVLLDSVEAADPARSRPVGMPEIRVWALGTAAEGSAAGAGGMPGDSSPRGGVGEAPAGSAPWESAAAGSVRSQLAGRRAERARPHRDEKVVSEWNALAVTALACAGEEFEESEWKDAAERACLAVLGANAHASGAGTGGAEGEASTDGAAGGLLIRSSTHGRPGPGAATLADAAGMLTACLTVLRVRTCSAGTAGTLRETAGRLLEQALSFVRTARSEDGRTRTVLLDVESDGIVPARGSDPLDSSQPSGRSALAEALRAVADAGLAAGQDASRLEELRRLLVFSALPAMQQAPRSASWMLAEAELPAE